MLAGRGSAGPALPFRLQHAARRATVFEGTAEPAAAVANWARREVSYAACDFSAFDEPGRYRIATAGAESAPFEIAPALLRARTLPGLLRYFRGQRCRGAYDEADRQAGFFGARPDRVDVHGGWYDASGDLSKYLSHLSYANFMNPQQTPLVVYNLLAGAELLSGEDETLAAAMRAEAAYGGDFLVRMQDPAGYFYATVFDRWSKKLEERLICAYETQQGVRRESYQAAYRQGGGLAIAALARLALSGTRGEHDAARYLEVAERGFAHLETHNVAYLGDGRENIVDDACALLAAAELFAAGSRPVHRDAARRRADGLLGRLASDERFSGYWRADDGDRPFFHASDAGLPVVALLRAAESGRSKRRPCARRCCARSPSSSRSRARSPNPFGYARQYVQPLGEAKRSSFFFPHRNESGYWWQGENARLASLATAAGLAVARLDPLPPQRERLRGYAYDQVDWVLGRNPFDSCMIFGLGRNNADYLESWPNYPGGVCNGITSGFEDEDEIAFLPEPQKDDMLQNWRWGEQWLPHAAWLVYALGALRAGEQRRP